MEFCLFSIANSAAREIETHLEGKNSDFANLNKILDIIDSVLSNKNDSYGFIKNSYFNFPFLIFLQNSKNFHDENINNYYEKLRYFKSELSRIKTLSNEELEKLRDDLYNLSASANTFGKVKKNIADKVSGNI